MKSATTPASTWPPRAAIARMPTNVNTYANIACVHIVQRIISVVCPSIYDRTSCHIHSERKSRLKLLPSLATGTCFVVDVGVVVVRVSVYCAMRPRFRNVNGNLYDDYERIAHIVCTFFAKMKTNDMNSGTKSRQYTES